MAKRTHANRTRNRSSTEQSVHASRRERRRADRKNAKTRRHQPRRESRTLTRRDALGILALGLFVGVSYLPAMLWGGFVWDDRVITEAPPIRELSGLWQLWFSPGDMKMWEGHYWPLVYSTFWLEHKLWGFNPAGYHIVNVLLHLVNTLLLWHLLARLVVPGAWIIAAAFAVHPLHVESVAWVIERKDLLSTLFYLGAFSAYIRFVAERRPRRYFLALFLFALGMLCKSIAVTLPVALLIYHWWKQGRTTGADLFRLVPFFAVGLFISIADASFYQSNEVISFGYSAIERVLIAARILWFYAGKLLWPTELAIIYPHWEVSVADPLAWAYLVATGAVAALLYFFRDRIGRGPLAGMLFFAVTLSPVLGFVDYGYMQFSFVADRYQYLAGIGVLLVVIGAAAYGASRCARQKIARAVAAVALVVLGTLTWRQSGIYRDKVTFWSHVIAHNPTAPIAHYNLGTALSGAGQLDEAEEHLRHALKLDPRDESARQNLGSVLVRKQRHEEAVAAYRRLIEINPRSAAAHSGLGIALYYMGRTDEALQSIDRALAIDPTFEEALINRKGMPQIRAHADAGVALMAQGKFDDAEKHLRHVLNLDPRYAIALQNLALLQLKRQHYDEALEHYRRLIETNPDNAAAHSGLGIALYHLGKIEDALASLDRALSLDPTLEDVRVNREVMRREKAITD